MNNPSSLCFGRLGLETVLAVETIDATFGVDDLLGTRVERMARGRDVDIDKRILDAVDLNGLLGGCARPRDELKIARNIFEDDEAITFWMDAFFHS